MRSVWTAQRKHVANFLSFIVLRLLALAAFAVSVPIFINNASDAAYGVIAIGFSLLGLSTIFDVGIGYVVTQVVGRRVARRNSAHPVAFNRLLWFYVPCALLVAAALTVAICFFPLSLRERFFYACLACLLPLLAVSGTAAAVFQAHGELVYLNSSRFLFEIGKGVAVAVSGLWLGDYVAVAPFLLVSALLRALADLYVLKARLRYELHVSATIEFRRAFRLASFGVWSMGAAMLTVAVHVLDKVMIANWLTKEDVAHYSIAFDLNTKAYLLVHALNSTMLTVLLHQHARRVPSKGQMRLTLAVVLAVAAFYYLPLAIWSEEVIALWVNPGFAVDTAPLVRIMAGASVLYLLASVFEVALLARANARAIFAVNAAAVSAYGLALLLLPSGWGATRFVWAYFVLCLVGLAGMVAGHLRYPGAAAAGRGD